MADPLTLRYNNPGAIEYKSWLKPYGATLGPGGRYAQFPDVDSGYKAMEGLLGTYQNKHGLNTVEGIVGRWAPRNVDNNSTDGYVSHVSKALGVAPNAPLDPSHRPRLAEAMAHYEAGRPVPRSGASATEQTGQDSMAMRPRGTRWDEALPGEGGEDWEEAARLGSMPGRTRGIMEPQGMPAQSAPMRGPAVGGYQARSAQMPQEEEKPSFLQDILGRASNPLFQQGLGMFLAARKGGDLNAGMNAGMDRASAMQNTLMANMKIKREMEQRAAVQKMLQNPEALAGMPPALAQYVQATGDMAPAVQHWTKGSGTDDIKEYEYAKARGFQGSLQDWMLVKKPNNGEYSKTPIFGVDGTGQTVMLQPGTRGDAVRTKLPDGVTVNSQKPIEIDAGTHTLLLDPITRQPIGQIPKNKAEVARQGEVGQGQGQAQVNLPTVESNAASTLAYITDIENDPGLGNVTGFYGGRAPNLSEGALATQARIDQLKGKAFLSAFEGLKGAGAITGTEGDKATAALTRLHVQAQSGEDYKKALADFRAEVQRLVDLARTKAGGAKSGGWSIQKVQ